MAKSKIEWTDTVWNPIRGCSLVSKGCTNCYAMKQAHRFNGKGQPYEGLTKLTSNGPVWTGDIKLVSELLEKPLQWKKPRRVFVNSMSDLFHEDVPFEFIASVFAVMSVTTRHKYQILTKRPERMLGFFKWAAGDYELTDFAADDKIGDYFPDWINWDSCGRDTCGPVYPYENVWLGVSVEDQKTADERIPLLLQTPAAVRWISAEPLLESVDLNRIHESFTDAFGTHTETWESCLNGKRFDIWSDGDIDGFPKIDWVVVGGESGLGARPMHPDWPKSLRDQCQAAGVPFFFKQWGNFIEAKTLPENTALALKKWQWITLDGHSEPASPTNPFHHENKCYCLVANVGKEKAGRLLDGKSHNEYPQ